MTHMQNIEHDGPPFLNESIDQWESETIQIVTLIKKNQLPAMNCDVSVVICRMWSLIDMANEVEETMR